MDTSGQRCMASRNCAARGAGRAWGSRVGRTRPRSRRCKRRRLRRSSTSRIAWSGRPRQRCYLPNSTSPASGGARPSRRRGRPVHRLTVQAPRLRLHRGMARRCRWIRRRHWQVPRAGCTQAWAEGTPAADRRSHRRPQVVARIVAHSRLQIDAARILAPENLHSDPMQQRLTTAQQGRRTVRKDRRAVAAAPTSSQ